MKLQYLGTGGAEGFPGMFCGCRACRRARAEKQYKARSCSLLNDSILIDLSPDLYMQSLRFDVDLTAVRALVVTHSHRDHLDPFGVCLRARDGASQRPDLSEEENRLPVYGGERVLETIRAELDNQPHANRARLELPRYGEVFLGEGETAPYGMLRWLRGEKKLSGEPTMSLMCD